MVRIEESNSARYKKVRLIRVGSFNLIAEAYELEILLLAQHI